MRRLRIALALVVLLVVACGFTVRTPPPAKAKPAPAPRLIFSDDFNGSALNLAKWAPNYDYRTGTSSITPPASGNENACYDPAQGSVSGGAWRVTAVARTCTTYDGYTYPFASDLLTTANRFSFIYGKVEVRAYVPSVPSGPDAGKIANWPQIWTTGYAQWPADGELDLFEGSWGWALHAYHAPGIDWSEYVNVPSPSIGWHTFAVDWRPGRITYYLDGLETGRYTGPGITSRPQYLMVGLGVYRYDQPAITPATMLVDYVRVWQ